MPTSELRPVSRSTLPDVVVGQIRDLVSSGRLRPGDRLPTERELCEMLSVGRSTVREALRVLTATGVVRRRRSTLIVNPEPPILVDSISKSTLREIFEARRLIEVGLARLAAERATDEQIAEIGRWLPPEGQTPTVTEFVDLDVGFHYAIATVSENRIITGYLLRVRDELFQSHKFYAALDSFDHEQAASFVQRIVADHRQIYAAIVSHRATDAQRAMESHFRHVERDIVRRLAGEAEREPGEAGEIG
jgi:GntR family transcriptional repressor for pyruvate dehydrogenase complex